MLCGSVSVDKNELEGFTLDLRVNLCNEKGEILFENRSYGEISFDKVKYDAFPFLVRIYRDLLMLLNFIILRSIHML